MSENKIVAVPKETQDRLIQAVNQCQDAARLENTMAKSLAISNGYMQLRQCLEIPEVKQLVLGFAGTPIGFVTDKDKKGGYGQEVVLNCVLEALTNGATVHGNEFNIIAGRCYFAQNFFARMLREWCFLHSCQRSINSKGIPSVIGKKGNQDIYEVKMTIAWKMPAMAERATQVNIYALIGMSTDQVIGKAMKRASQWLYNELSNNNFSVAPDDEDFVDSSATTVKEEVKTATNGKTSLDRLIEKHGQEKVVEKMLAMSMINNVEELSAFRENAGSMNLLDSVEEDFSQELI